MRVLFLLRRFGSVFGYLISGVGLALAALPFIYGLAQGDPSESVGPPHPGFVDYCLYPRLPQFGKGFIRLRLPDKYLASSGGAQASGGCTRSYGVIVFLLLPSMEPAPPAKLSCRGNCKADLLMLMVENGKGYPPIAEREYHMILMNDGKLGAKTNMGGNVDSIFDSRFSEAYISRNGALPEEVWYITKAPDGSVMTAIQCPRDTPAIVCQAWFSPPSHGGLQVTATLNSSWLDRWPEVRAKIVQFLDSIVVSNSEN